MDGYRTRIEVLHSGYYRDFDKVKAFLSQNALDFEEDTELAVLVYYDEQAGASACLAGSIVKGVAVNPLLEGEGLAALAVSQIIAEAANLGRRVLRVFTRPKNIPVFKQLGFSVLAESGDDAVLLENDSGAFAQWAASAAAQVKTATIYKAARYDLGAVVVNANPFTLGHRSLIERAAAQCGQVVVFVVEADNSLFPFEVRYDLVKKGIEDLTNVTAIKSGPYIISNFTFPTYFIKEKSRSTEIHAQLDLNLFAKKIAPAFGIGVRFIANEPYCPVTSVYNRIMHATLPPLGIDCQELPRFEYNGQAISASAVREALRSGNEELLAHVIPKTTLEYLQSAQAESVIKKIKAGTTRH